MPAAPSADVLIVGAGAAGLACASRLARAGIRFALLEAAPRVGGRAHTATWAVGDEETTGFELGATWLHGVDGHPLYEVARAEGLLGTSAPRRPRKAPPAEDEAALAAGGWLLPGELASTTAVRGALRTAEELMDATLGFTADAAAEADSVGGFVRRRFAEGAPSPVELAALEWRLRMESSISGVEPSRLSLRWFGEYAELDGGNKRVHSMQALLERVAGALPAGALRLSHTVRSVRWAGGGEAAADGAARGVRVVLADGAELDAAHLVVTASLGLLKEAIGAADGATGGGALTFGPPLPAAHAGAIGRLGMGTVNKLFLRFGRRWWREHASFRLLWPDDAAAVRVLLAAHGLPPWADCFYQFGSERAAADGEAAVLVGWLVGAGAVEVEALPDAEVANVAAGVLRLFVPAAPHPTALRLSRWRAEPLARGSYSYVPLGGSSGADFDVLAAPLCDGGGVPRVLFAGEACHRTYYSTLHGAWLSGQAQAERLLEHLQAAAARRTTGGTVGGTPGDAVSPQCTHPR